MDSTRNPSPRKTILRRPAGRKPYSTVPMAPMIDMIFLLLIFFLVAAKYRPQEDFLPFKLPAARGADQSLVKPDPLTVRITQTDIGCRVQIAQIDTVMINDNNIEVGLAELMKKMKNRLLDQKRFADDPIEIICDPNVKWQHTAEIYNIFFGAGMTDITFRMTE